MDPLLQDLCGLKMEHFPLILCEGYVFIHINICLSQPKYFAKSFYQKNSELWCMFARKAF